MRTALAAVLLGVSARAGAQGRAAMPAMPGMPMSDTARRTLEIRGPDRG